MLLGPSEVCVCFWDRVRFVSAVICVRLSEVSYKFDGSVFRETSQLMLFREIMAVCSEINTKHINTLCGQNVELLNVKLAVHVVTTGL